MKNLLKIWLTAFALMFFFGAFSIAEAKTKLEKLLNKMSAQYRSLQTLRADVQLEKYNVQLDESDISKGVLYFIPKHYADNRMDNLRLDWTRPVAESLSLIGWEATLYRPRLKQVLIGNVSENKNIVQYLKFLTMSGAEIKSKYDIKYLGKKKIRRNVKLRELELRPKTESPYKSALFRIDKNGQPVEVQVFEKNQGWTKLTLSVQQRNRPLKAEVFTVSYPNNIKPIRF